MNRCAAGTRVTDGRGFPRAGSCRPRGARPWPRPPAVVVPERRRPANLKMASESRRGFAGARMAGRGSRARPRPRLYKGGVVSRCHPRDRAVLVPAGRRPANLKTDSGSRRGFERARAAARTGGFRVAVGSGLGCRLRSSVQGEHCANGEPAGRLLRVRIQTRERRAAQWHGAARSRIAMRRGRPASLLATLPFSWSSATASDPPGQVMA